VPVLHDEFVTARNLASRRRRGLDGALPHGTRAMRVVVTDSLRPRPGAGVDVLATFGSANDVVAGDDQTDPASGEAVVVARGALVLAVDDTRAADGSAGLGVTLLLSPRQSRELAFAVTHGVVTIALVPPEDADRP
jgi:Flp pilus assembly protein CpaB